MDALDAHGQFIAAVSWLAIIFNPGFGYRLAHKLSAAWLITALLIGGVGDWHRLPDRAGPRAPELPDGDDAASRAATVKAAPPTAGLPPRAITRPTRGLRR